jgi:hypothetical protein
VLNDLNGSQAAGKVTLEYAENVSATSREPFVISVRPSASASQNIVGLDRTLTGYAVQALRE